MKSSKDLTRGLQALLDESYFSMNAAPFLRVAFAVTLAVALAFGEALNLYMGNLVAGAALFCAMLVIMPAVIYVWLAMQANRRSEMIEKMLPNFLSMMASNIRSGITYDRALLLSTRKEFGPLAEEIERAAKQTIAGKPLTEAMMDMAKRTRSETFAKTMRLIVEGTAAGGNLAEMLETTAIDIRQSASLKREISATIMVYRLFIVISSAIGAPLLYGLTGFLIKIFVDIRANTASTAVAGPLASSLPLMSGKGGMISPELFFWYAVTAIAVTVFLSALASGMITKGKETEGLPDLGWMLAVAFAIFFGVNHVFGLLVGHLAF